MLGAGGSRLFFQDKALFQLEILWDYGMCLLEVPGSGQLYSIGKNGFNDSRMDTNLWILPILWKREVEDVATFPSSFSLLHPHFSQNFRDENVS